MDNCTGLPPIPPNIVSIAGPLLLGFLFNWCLYGVFCIQVYIYYLAFPNDDRVNQVLVYAMFFIETAQTVLITHDSFHAYAIGYGNVEVLNSAQLEWLAIPILSGVVSMVVQLFYGYRLTVLSGSKSLGLVIAAAALTQGSAAITQGVQAQKVGNFSDLASKAFISAAIWLIMSAVCDLIIAASMTYTLLRKDTRLASTHAAISRVIRIVVETGCLTAAAAIVNVTLFLAVRDNTYFAGAALVQAKLYANSFLVIFNSRIRIVGGRNAASTAAFMEPSISLGDVQNRSKSLIRRVPLRLGQNSVHSTGKEEATVGTVVIRKEIEMWTDAGETSVDASDQRSFRSAGSHPESIGSLKLDNFNSKLGELLPETPTTDA